MVNEKVTEQAEEKAAFTYNKHLAKACRHLDAIFLYFQKEYKLDFNPIPVQCPELKKGELNFMEVS